MSKTPAHKTTHHSSKKKCSTAEIVGQGQLLFIEIPYDEMSARVTVLPPDSVNDPFVTVDDLLIAMASHNVVFGVDNRALAEISAKIAQNAASKSLTEMVEADLAFGIPAVKSRDAQVEYFYKDEEPAESEGLPMDEEGQINYRAGRKIDNVKKGDLLIRKTPAVNGTPGKTVTGKIVPAPPGKDIVLGIGKGVVIYPENPDEYYADTDGQVVIKGGLITVQPIFEVRGDVDLKIGNINFFGTVIVHGDVKDNFKIYAGQDLIVRGVVEGAELKVDGNLTISGGVAGNDKAHITCKGNALIKYIRNTRIEVDGNLNVKQSILHSTVNCDHTITVGGAKGMIVGGQVIARREITAATFGSSFGTATEIIVGHQIDLREQILTAEIKLKEVAKNLDKTRKALIHLNSLHARNGALPADKQELYKWLSRALVKLTADSKLLTVKKTELEVKQRVFLEEKPVPRVNCLHKIYPGVKVTINRAYTVYSDEQKYCSLIDYEGEVRVSTLKTRTKADESLKK